MKSISADCTFSSCRFRTLYDAVYTEKVFSNFFNRPVVVFLTGKAAQAPSSCVVSGSSNDDETVHSVSATRFVVTMFGFVSVVKVASGEVSTPKPLKYPPPRCVSQLSSFLRSCTSIFVISFLSASPGLRGSKISMSNVLCNW